MATIVKDWSMKSLRNAVKLIYVHADQPVGQTDNTV